MADLGGACCREVFLENEVHEALDFLLQVEISKLIIKDWMSVVNLRLFWKYFHVSRKVHNSKLVGMLTVHEDDVQLFHIWGQRDQLSSL